MFRLLTLFFILAVSLSALSDSAVLKRADALMKTTNKSDQFRAYNDYKSLYLRAIISEDETLRTNALKGIVKSGNLLHIDVSKYADELSQNESRISYKIPKSKPKLKTYVPKRDNKDSQKDVKIKSTNKLKSVNFIGEKLILEFDKNLTRKQINYFTLLNDKKKQFKYIFDVHASMLVSAKSLSKKGIKRIKLAQYKPSTIRLVIENDKKVKIKFYKEAKKLVIGINDSNKNNSVKSKDNKPVIQAKDKVIVLDAGHGGKDPGAMGYKNYREKIVVMQVAQHLKSILKSRGYKVYMTRDRDKFVKLSNRTQYANKKNADIFISIHANAVSKKNANTVHGIECYFLSKSRSNRAKKVAEKENSADLSDMNFYGKESFLNTLNSHNIVASNKLAIDLQRGMLGSLTKTYKDIYDGGVREGPFWVLVGAQMPSVLVEVGFISHPTEAKRLVNTKYQKKLALGLADGIERYFANNH